MSLDTQMIDQDPPKMLDSIRWMVGFTAQAGAGMAYGIKKGTDAIAGYATAGETHSKKMNLVAETGLTLAKIEQKALELEGVAKLESKFGEKHPELFK